MKKHPKISVFYLIMSSLLWLVFSFSSNYGNVPLHEWTSSTEESNFTVSRSLSGAETKGELEHITPENLTTWIFEDGTFIPMAKLQGEKAYSIITDHFEGGALKKDVGHLFSERARLRQRETEAYDEQGDKVWSRQLNIYGETRRESGEKNFIPFLYQGQYFDEETELAYNRYRYYSPETGLYVSQDPIRLKGDMPNMYAYVKNSNRWVDPYGLSGTIQIMLLEGQGGGDHYKVIYEARNGPHTTDFIIQNGNPEVRNGKGRFTNNLIESKTIPITRSKKGIGGAVDAFGDEFKKAYMNNKNLDCFDFVSGLAKHLGADITIDDSLSNRQNFANIECSG